ncbi:hypothetical protein ABR737_07260 [Streptomyces sp. Edi2]|uniref:hypothetical protein n=1 Tax=Streptomyces sp. Edi2 TaxID=3162528 RepID=UPI0033061BE1
MRHDCLPCHRGIRPAGLAVLAITTFIVVTKSAWSAHVDRLMQKSRNAKRPKKDGPASEEGKIN